MAFFRNYNSKINSGHNLDEKVEEDRPAEDYNSVGNRNVDVNVNYNDADMTGDANQNEEEQFNTGRLQIDNSEGDASGKLGKRAAPTGAWGSKFWKVCQPMSDSGDAEYDHNDLGEDAGDNYSEDSNVQKDRRQSQRGHVEVPAEEMLSDDYYEQDGEEQSDSLHGSGPSHLNVAGSRLLTQPVSVSKSIAKGAKVARHEEYNDDGDDDDDYDEDDEEEGYVNVIHHILLVSFSLLFAQLNYFLVSVLVTLLLLFYFQKTIQMMLILSQSLVIQARAEKARLACHILFFILS